MRYAQIRELDVANGPGIRVTIFVTGCTHKCEGCFNEEYQDFNFGELWTREENLRIKKLLSKDVIDGLTILGGEPFENCDGLIELLNYLKSNGILDEKTVWIYSGDTYEEIIKNPKKLKLLELCDVLVDGRFVEELKDLRLNFRGSSNQRIINIQNSLKTGQIELNELN